jgi:triosephosphate isomerase
MRKLVVGNWKMNGSAAALAELEAIKAMANDVGCDVVVCPPFTLLEQAVRTATGSPLAISAQDYHAFASGAYTGDVSAEMLADAGATYVILGHSERRSLHGETDVLVSQEASAVHRAGLTAIVCVGETTPSTARRCPSSSRSPTPFPRPWPCIWIAPSRRP